MTTEEFSNEFDILLNSESSISEFGTTIPQNNVKLDEYEKSVYLSKAQIEIVTELYNGKNQFGDSFEKTEEVRRYLSDLVKTYTTTTKLVGNTGLSSKSVFMKLPEDLLFITYESAVLTDETLGCLNNRSVIVIPVSQDEYNRIQSNPFKGCNKNRVLRLDIDNKTVELVSSYNISSYLARYICRPSPIILTELQDNLSIDGETARTECKLNSNIHRTILERAVKLALVSRVPMDVSNNK